MVKPYKQGIDISFARGLDTKTDPKRVAIGNFVALENMVFDTGGLLKKRNGFGLFPTLPQTPVGYLTTFNGNLTAIGNSIEAHDASGSPWVNKGSIQPMSLNAAPLVRNNLNQTAVDAAVAPNGLICTAYLESDGTTTTNKYMIADSATGQNIIAPAVIPVASGAVSGGMRVFVLGNYFIIIFTNTITAVAHLQFIAIPTNNPTAVTANTDIAANYTSAATLGWDGVVVGNRLFVAYNTTSGGQAVKVTAITTSLTVSTATTFAASNATSLMSLCADTTVASPIVYLSFYNSGTTSGFTAAVDQNLNKVLNPTQIISSGTMLNMASFAQNGICTVFYEVSNTYSFDSTVATNYVAYKTVTQSGTISSQSISARSIGLASKAFLINGVGYYLGIYVSPYQSTYFLMNGSTSLSSSPVVVARLAYQNAGGYLTKGLPNVSLTDTVAQVPYLFKDLITPVNKETNPATGTQTVGIYSQTGINLASFNFSQEFLDTAEISDNLHMSGGFLWMYDGQIPVEQNFFLYPSVDLGAGNGSAGTPTITAVWSTSGGSIVAKPDTTTNSNVYWYQITYEWTDNQGNAFRSAPSLPVPVTTTGSGTAGSITLNIATLRLTYKIASPVKIVIYRWSLGQQVYYQTTSITQPLLNDTTVDSVQFVDTNSDSTILGNNILYINGGVLPNSAAPATDLLILFDNRLWVLDSENRNLLWYSQEVRPGVPVEMSQSLTYYIAPTTGAQGNTGPITATWIMDDKFIAFKSNAIYYFNGRGPDATGLNSQYSEPIFITTIVGCANQDSIVLIPPGLMFQSNKGIWLLGRDLTTTYIGAPVQQFNGSKVLSAQDIPGTNQVRFILDTGEWLVYDYYYGQWATFTGIPAISSCMYQDKHTFLNASYQVYQENADSYLDGSNPVLMYFKTGPIRLGALQNYQRVFFYFLLGNYLSPVKLITQNYYDYSETPEDQAIITMTEDPSTWGSDYVWGASDTWGGTNNLRKRVFTSKQRCMAIGISLQEIYDPSFGVAAGAGFTLSGLNVVCGFKGPFRTQSAANSVGA